MNRARLLAALLLVLALLPASAGRAACTPPGIYLTSAPTSFVFGKSVVVSGYVYGLECVPEQRAPVTMRVHSPGSPGTNWSDVVQTNQRGKFTLRLKSVEEPGIVLTIAAPILDKVTGGVAPVVTATVGPLRREHALTLSAKKGPHQPGTVIQAKIRTTDQVCASTHTVQIRPKGGHWQAWPRTFPGGDVCHVNHEGKVEKAFDVSMPQDNTQPLAPTFCQPYQLRLVTDPVSSMELASVSPPVDVRVRVKPPCR